MEVQHAIYNAESDTWVVSVRPVKHGTYSGYSNHGCRCNDCRAAHNDWHRQYRSSANGRITTMRANRKARLLQQFCTAWVKEHHPDMYEEFVIQALERANTEVEGNTP